MPLKIDLRSGERLYIGSSSLLIASDERSTVIIDGTLPVIRERDYLHEEEGATPLRTLTQAVQVHYLTPSASSLNRIYKIYFGLDGGHSPQVEEAMKCVAEGDMYRSLRLLRAEITRTAEAEA